MPALFYHVTQSPVEGVVETLLTRALAQGWRVELRGVAPERMDWLDQKLWLGPEEDFLPHGLAGGPHDALQPVLLTTSPRPEGRQAVMTLDGAEVTPAEVAALTAVAREYKLPVHMDGARFANALVSLGCTPAEVTWKAGVDVLSFGGTKNGCMGVEAVVIFDPARAWEFELRRKRGGHLFSKHRFLAAQMAAYLEGDLWLRLARQANAMATRLSQGIAAVPGASLTHPTQANEVFAAFPRAAHRAVHAAGASYYLWPFDQSLDGPGEVPLAARMVTTWDTTEAEIDAFLAHLR